MYLLGPKQLTSPPSHPSSLVLLTQDHPRAHAPWVGVPSLIDFFNQGHCVWVPSFQLQSHSVQHPPPTPPPPSNVAEAEEQRRAPMGSIGSGPCQDSLLWAMGSLGRAEQEHDKDNIIL